MPAPQVAEWAGHGVNVLLRVYAEVVEGQYADSLARIEGRLSGPQTNPVGGETSTRIRREEPTLAGIGRRQSDCFSLILRRVRSVLDRRLDLTSYSPELVG